MLPKNIDIYEINDLSFSLIIENECIHCLMNPLPLKIKTETN